jgi:hypothetical protein
MNAPAQRLAKMLLRASAAGLLWAAAAPMAASAESSWTLEPANSGREPIAQSCTTGDRDRCVDDVTRCFRDCDTLERCNRTCCLAFHDCLSSHACILDAAICKGF